MKVESQSKRSGKSASTNVSGAYSLVIYLRRPVSLRVGQAGKAKFERGYYVYTGSGGRSVSPRVIRHLRRSKPLKWHVDYLLACPEAKVLSVVLWPGNPRRTECAVNRWLLRAADGKFAMRGFGSTDCREGCPTHLIFFQEGEPLKHLLMEGSHY